MKRFFIYFTLSLAVLQAMTGCDKKTNYGTDPYGEKLIPLGVKFADQLPNPSQAKPGASVTYQIEGADKYPNLEFFVNNVKVNVENVSDTTITIKLPEVISTGGAKIVIDGQTFAGPITQILGKVAIDPTFTPGTGTNGPIYKIKHLTNGQILLGGYFSDYNGNNSLGDINSLVRISSTGEFVTGMGFGVGAKEGAGTGSVLGIEELSDGKLLIYGTFNEYNKDLNVKNITILNSTGSLYKESVAILNLTEDPEKNTLLVPAFNGGTDRGIIKTFIKDNKITAIGNFDNFTNNYYARSTYNNILKDYFRFDNILRMEMNGALDSSYLVNRQIFPARGGYGVNGTLSDATMTNDGKIILVGMFTRYNNAVNSNHIIRLNADGTADQSFAIGSGANEQITKIIPYTNGRYFLIGSFSQFNGQEANGIVLINGDGTVDASFKSKKFEKGIPNYLTVLANGKILVTGSFSKYNEVIREGLMVLNPDGTLAKDFNNTGMLKGFVNDSYQSMNSIGQKTVTLVGSIQSFNGKLNVGNIIRLTIQD